MNKTLIYKYIESIKKEDIINYFLKENIIINIDDVNIIYNYLKNDYLRIMNNPKEILDEMKNKVSNNLYLKIIELYDKYKNILN